MGKDLLDELLTASVNKKASDLHLSSGVKPIIYLDGNAMDVGEKYQELSSEDISEMLESIMNDYQKELFKIHSTINITYEIKDVGYFRANGLLSNQGVSAIFRIIPNNDDLSVE